MKTTIVLTVEHTKEIPDLLDKIAGRVHTIDGVNQGHPESVTAKFIELRELPVVDMEASE